MGEKGLLAIRAFDIDLNAGDVMSTPKEFSLCFGENMMPNRWNFSKGFSKHDFSMPTINGPNTIIKYLIFFKLIPDSCCCLSVIPPFQTDVQIQKQPLMAPQMVMMTPDPMLAQQPVMFAPQTMDPSNQIMNPPNQATNPQTHYFYQ